MLPHYPFTSIALLPFAHFPLYPFPSFPPLPISLIPLTTHFFHSPLPSSPHFPFLIFPSLPYLPPTSPSISIGHLFLCLSFPTAILLTTHLPPPTTDFSPHLPPWVIFLPINPYSFTVYIPSLPIFPSLLIFSYFPYSSPPPQLSMLPTVHLSSSHIPIAHIFYHILFVNTSLHSSLLVLSFPASPPSPSF